jgi:hypothetical protein
MNELFFLFWKREKGIKGAEETTSTHFTEAAFGLILSLRVQNLDDVECMFVS